MATKVHVIVLAAGQGKRMHGAFPGTPKVLVPLRGKPMLLHVLDAVAASGVAFKTTVVIGPTVEEKVCAAVKDPAITFALQPEPRGTGHAVLCARGNVGEETDHVLVLYGDQPLILPGTIRELVDRHAASDAAITMLTVRVPDFAEWRSSFVDWGRIVRDEAGKFLRSVEAKDASEEERAILEVNPSFYCFRASWLWEHLPRVGCANAQGEYYLPDVLALAGAQGARIETTTVQDPREALGANTPEQLAVLEQVSVDLARRA